MTQNNKFKKPDCWDDDERMNALFQPFRPRQVNPHNFDAKLKFWEDLIYEYCKYQKGDPSFSKSEIQLSFKRKDKLALCLDTVIEDMISQKIIHKMDDLLSNPYNTWTMWAVNSFVKNPVRWGLSRVWGKTSVDTEDTKYYHASVLKELSDELMNVLMNHQGKVLKTEDLLAILKPKMQLNNNGLTICLINLYHNHKILVDFEIVKGHIKINLIKVPGKDGTKETFTEYDKTMVKLKETKDALEDQVTNLENEISKYHQSAKKCISEKNQRMAKVHLKKKLFLQDQCDKKSNILHNVETLIANMEDAQSNGEILNVYKMGTDSLKSVMSTNGLTIENVDEIMSTMKDITEEHTEIQNAMSNIDNTSMYENDGSLENELADILAQNSIDLVKEKENSHIDNEKLELEKELIDLLENLEVETSTPANLSTISLEKTT
ncbi:charged multivesicular body protein 7 [Condylostylus longicornis]|uniref:charged multivesicular body protein 7 n=1 Tax=Condylostylus longicornis TaxID=2530218 RepID=UPI00244E26CE|nr:charged multivesicular body protein 7 [Condylostylus longicornis]